LPLALLRARRGLATTAAAAPPAAGGDLYVWGRISEGKLGMRAPESAYNMRDHARPGGPFVLPLLNPSLANVTEVVCRQARTMALTADGSVYSWGTCDNASLGHGDKVTALGSPRKIEALAGIRIVHVRGREEGGAPTPGRRRRRARLLPPRAPSQTHTTRRAPPFPSPPRHLVPPPTTQAD
jgi:hypothetical protein